MLEREGVTTRTSALRLARSSPTRKLGNGSSFCSHYQGSEDTARLCPRAHHRAPLTGLLELDAPPARQREGPEPSARPPRTLRSRAQRGACDWAEAPWPSETRGHAPRPSVPRESERVPEQEGARHEAAPAHRQSLFPSEHTQDQRRPLPRLAAPGASPGTSHAGRQGAPCG